MVRPFTRQVFARGPAVEPFVGVPAAGVSNCSRGHVSSSRLVGEAWYALATTVMRWYV